MARRSKMRDLVFKIIFQNEFRKDVVDAVLQEVLSKEKSDSIRKDVERYVRGIYSHIDSIDQKISSCLENWTLERLSSVDRCVLRLGTYELLYEPDVPRAGDTRRSDRTRQEVRNGQQWEVRQRCA